MAERLNFETDGRNWPNRAASRFVTAGGLRWHVQVVGEGPVLLLLHGTAAGTHSWRDMMGPLAEHFTVVAPDLPGHAFTSAPPAAKLSLPGMAGAVAELLRVMNLSPVLAAGHSAGPQRCANKQPTCVLGLCDERSQRLLALLQAGLH